MKPACQPGGLCLWYKMGVENFDKQGSRAGRQTRTNVVVTSEPDRGEKTDRVAHVE